MRSLLAIVLLLIPAIVSAEGAEWRSLEPGLEYRREASSLVHLFRIDPQRFRMDLLTASGTGAAALTAERYRERSGALLVINGGFFDELYRPLGLLYRNGATVNPLRPVDWGIFQIASGVPSILHRRQWRGEGVTGEGVEMALQVGPRLVIDGRIPSFKPEPEPHRRSALGVTPGGWVLVALSELPLGIREWAELLKKEAASALNLDGGGSSQLSARVGNLSLQIEGLTGVPNAVAVFPK